MGRDLSSFAYFFPNTSVVWKPLIWKKIKRGRALEVSIRIILLQRNQQSLKNVFIEEAA